MEKYINKEFSEIKTYLSKLEENQNIQEELGKNLLKIIKKYFDFDDYEEICSSYYKQCDISKEKYIEQLSVIYNYEDEEFTLVDYYGKQIPLENLLNITIQEGKIIFVNIFLLAY